MRLILLPIAGAALVTACSPAGQEPNPQAPVVDANSSQSPPAPSIDADTAQASTPPEAAQAPTTSPRPVTPTPAKTALLGGECGAGERQDWVGQPRGVVPAPPTGADWRVFETGDVLIQDLRSTRLNVEVDPTTQRILSVRCF